MKNLLITVLHFAVVTAKLCGHGGVRAVIAENLVLKQATGWRWVSHCGDLVQLPVAA
jgi:hypothetical protein